MIIENNAGGHAFRDRTCVHCKMTKDQFSESGYPECKGRSGENDKRSGLAYLKADNGAA